MSQYKIVIDSCGELPEDLKADGHFLHSAAFCWMWMAIRSQMMKLLIREISCRE